MKRPRRLPDAHLCSRQERGAYFGQRVDFDWSRTLENRTLQNRLWLLRLRLFSRTEGHLQLILLARIIDASRPAALILIALGCPPRTSKTMGTKNDGDSHRLPLVADVGTAPSKRLDLSGAEASKLLRPRPISASRVGEVRKGF